jgi:hypothetical protein
MGSPHPPRKHAEPAARPISRGAVLISYSRVRPSAPQVPTYRISSHRKRKGLTQRKQRKQRRSRGNGTVSSPFLRFLPRGSSVVSDSGRRMTEHLRSSLLPLLPLRETFLLLFGTRTRRGLRPVWANPPVSPRLHPPGALLRGSSKGFHRTRLQRPAFRQAGRTLQQEKSTIPRCAKLGHPCPARCLLRNPGGRKALPALGGPDWSNACFACGGERRKGCE